MNASTLALSPLLAGCAFVSGPCSITMGAERSIICEAGGQAVIVPAPKMPAVVIERPQPATNEARNGV